VGRELLAFQRNRLGIARTRAQRPRHDFVRQQMQLCIRLFIDVYRQRFPFEL
jgi:hypothetical protein